MFDFMFDLMEAWNQIGLMIGGLVLSLIGVAAALYGFHGLFNGMKFRAQITGISATGVKSEAQKERARTQKKKKRKEREPIFSKERFKKTPLKESGALFFLVLIFCLPLSFAGIGGYFLYDYASVRIGGVYVEGTVIENRYERSSDSSSYHAIVSFSDQRGKRRTTRDSMGKGGTPFYKIGEKVPVYYNPEDFSHTAVGGVLHNTILPFVFFAVGGVIFFFLCGGGVWLGDKIYERRKRDGSRAPTGYGGEIYYPVYEYISPEGQKITATGESGSNMLTNKLPGMWRKISIMPNAPDIAVTPGFVPFLFAACFGVPGLIMLYIAFARFETSIFTFLFVGAGIVFLTYKARQSIKIGRGWDKKKSWRENLKIEITSEKPPKGELLSSRQISDRLSYYDRCMNIWNVVLVIAVAALLWGGFHTGKGMQAFLLSGTSAMGEVVKIESVRASDDSGYSYFPIVGFTANDAREYEFRDKVGSGTPLYRVGEELKVIYDPEDPMHAMVDRGIWNWTLSCGLLLGGLLLLWAIMKSFIGRIKRRSLIPVS